MRSRATALLAAAVLMLVSACGAGPRASDDSGSPAGAGQGDASESPREDVPSALDDADDPAFPDPLIALDDLISGGPPPDGIPPIDDPVFEPEGDVDWLDGEAPLLSVTVGGETRGYPLAIMTWHEIVNDTVGGVPIAVTYCPLCNSGVAFERQAGDRLLDFGTSGMLYIDNLVMYDRQTESLWPQLTGQASVGVLTGTQLKAIPLGVVGWDQFRTAHPGALVLTRETGADRDYGRNPYAGYDDPDGGLLVEPPGGRDPRLPVKARVVGIQLGEESVAIARDRIAEAGVLTVSVGGRDLTVWHRPGQRSALGDSEIAEAEDIGTIGVFDPKVAGRTLTFSPEGDGFVDQQTGSRWNVLGQATEGSLKGRQLRAVTNLDTFWFAWVGFRPDTRLVS